MANFWAAIILLTILTVHSQILHASPSTNSIGICYGRVANNIPAPRDVINLYKKIEVRSLRLFDPDPVVLGALRGSNIQVTLGIRDQDLPALAASKTAVEAWFTTNVKPYVDDVAFRYIAVGNEVIPGPFAQFVSPVIQSLQSLLEANNLLGIKVSTVVHSAVLANTYPPSASTFTSEAASVMANILQYLSQSGSPILANVYPYFAYAGNPKDVHLEYALFNTTNCVVCDQGLCYTNLFAAMVDSFVWAIEKVGVANVGIVVSESGWPSAGNGEFTTPALAQAYVKNFMKHISSNTGTPKRPGAAMEGFIFAMFNENMKTPGVEQNFGLFYPNMQPVYPIFS